MSTPRIASLILAAGKGTRMRSHLPKVMHPIAFEPMLAHVLRTATSLNSERIVALTGPEMKQVEALVSKHTPDAKIVVQQERLGTAHAVLCMEDALQGFEGVVLVLYGDTPLVTKETLHQVVEITQNSAVTVVGVRMPDPTGYGRLIADEENGLLGIVECAEANEIQARINLCNSGIMAIQSEHLLHLLKKVENNNSKGEYYLTDIVNLARRDGLHCALVEAEAEEMLGINTRAQLAEAEFVMQQRLRLRAMDRGVTMVDPESVYLSADTFFGHDVVIHPNVVCMPAVTVGNKVEIRAFSHLEGATVGDHSVIGPFARLRPATQLAENVHVGNFVEIKKSTLAQGAKVNHLSYIGDTTVGEKANIGAGTITCNYDGTTKHATAIGREAFVGSNTSLVAPVTIGDGAIIGAGSVITKDIPPDALAFERGSQTTKEGKAKEMRKKKT